jgi:isopenicillin-N epimerase
VSRPAPSALASHWTLDPAVTFLNHGAHGACPRVVLELQSELRARLERQPVRFFLRDLEGLLDQARAALGAFLGADPDDLAFVDNATSGVNTVLRSLELGPGDEVLTTNHEYNASANAARAVTERARARLVVAEVPFPLRGPEDVAAAVLAAVSERTRLVLIDHVTSPTGIRFPVETLVPALHDRGIDMLVDGAHAPGMLPLDLTRLGAAYYTGNCHKWLCAPKGSAFLHVRRDRQARIRPLTISHGANSPRQDRSRFRLEFDFTGTRDPTPALCVGRALEFVGGLFPGGWPEIMALNGGLARRARTILCEALGVSPPCPESMLGSLAAVSLPDGSAQGGPSPLLTDPLQDWLLFERGIEVPVYPWPASPRRWIRVSPHLHNSEAQYVFLAAALREALS